MAMVWAMLRASLATHRSISCYVTSLLAPNLTPPTLSRTLRLSLGAHRFLMQTMAFTHLLGGLGPRAFDPVVDLKFPIPVFARSLLFACANNSFRSMPGIPAPLARSHTTVICKEDNIKPPATRSTSQKYQSIVTRKFTSQKYHILENVLVPSH